jgi:fatty-acyl-CoA synthase
MPAANAAALLRRNASDPAISGRVAVRFGDETWTHGEYVAECRRWAQLFLSHRRARGSGSPRSHSAPFHVGVLLDNVPEYLFALGGAALAGATVVGLNPTRVGEHLVRDATHTDVALVVTEPRHEATVEPLSSSMDVLVAGSSLDKALASVSDADPGLDPDPATPWALIFTSGTSGAPKAVICSQRRIMVTGTRMGIILGVGPDDVGYVCMPLFHSNAVMVGWAPSLVHGCSVALARRFSASGWLPDVRRYGATYWNYTGKPLAYLLATPERADDADNPLRVAYGNEGAPRLVEAFARRFDVHVIDAFGATEGGVAVQRVDGMPEGAVGLAGENVRIVDAETGAELPRARFRADGTLENATECVGEIVNVGGVGPFEGYYNNDEANARTMRNGWYWSGDLGYLDADGYLFFAGRNADWIRVDGENFPAGPIENAVLRHPDVLAGAVYGVPDAQAGDQVMAALVLRDGASFDPAAFATWVDGLVDVGPKWRPRYVRLCAELPRTPTNKVLTRVLVHEKFRLDRVGDGDEVWVRERDDASFRAFDAAAEAALRDEFAANGRARFWDL